MSGRGTRGTLAALLLGSLPALMLASLLLAAAPAARAAVPSAGPAGVERQMDSRITESSGLAVSLRHAGVLWTHDDSGHPPVLYALARDGSIAGRLRLQGVADVDWEAVAVFRDAAGAALLAAGDLGDNDARRASVEVDLVAEPAHLGESQVRRPLLRLKLHYPQGARDAEALLVDTAQRRMFVVTKGFFGGEVYAVPEAAWSGTAPRVPAPDRTATLVRVARMPLGLVTDGTVAPGGAVLLRTYGELAAFPPLPLAPGDRLLTPAATDALPSQRQGEGLALAADGRSVLLSSEGSGEPVLRVGLPAAVRAVLSASAGPAAGAGRAASRTPGSGAGAQPAGARATGGSNGTGVPWLPVAAGTAVAALLAVRARRGRR